MFLFRTLTFTVTFTSEKNVVVVVVEGKELRRNEIIIDLFSL